MLLVVKPRPSEHRRLYALEVAYPCRALAINAKLSVCEKLK